MERSFRSVLILLAGIALLATAGSIRAIGTDSVTWPALLGLAGLALVAWGGYSLRTELGAMVRQRRGEIALLHTGRDRRAGSGRLPVGSAFPCAST